MKTAYVCFNLKALSCSQEDSCVYERDYNLIYKPLIQFLYSHIDFPFSFSLNGNLLYYFRNRKSEILSLLKELIERKQIEIIGGGFYDPILPLIYPADRNGQIDLLTTEIRHSLGRRPRGMTIHSDIWDSNLINNIHTCGIDYVLLDSSLIPEKKNLLLPLVVSDLGKTVDVFPYYENLKPTPDVSSEDFINNIINSVELVEKHSPISQINLNRVITINLSHSEMAELIKDDWFTRLYHYLNAIDNVKLTTPYYFRKDNKFKLPVYIPSGISDNVGKYIASPFKAQTSKNQKSFTIYDYMETYYLSQNLNSRMIYVTMLINQYKNDKQKKKAARDFLWKAQSGNNYIFNDKEVGMNFGVRKEAYKDLMSAELLIREGNKFKSTVNCFDYNGDGLNEYVCRMRNYFLFVSLLGGCIHDLEFLSNHGNYADNMARLLPFDDIQDGYRRGLFVDHFFTDKQLSQYVKNEDYGDNIFPNLSYVEHFYSQSNRLITLEANGSLRNNVSIRLRKTYVVNDNGLQVIYIIKNTSEKKIKINFAVELNFDCLNYKGIDNNFYKLELVANNEHLYINDDKKLVSGNKNRINNKLEIVEESSEIENRDYDNLINEVTTFYVKDIDNNVKFSFEPNEQCSFCFNTIEYKRPDQDGNLHKVEKTFVATPFWRLEIEPGMETEKNLSVIFKDTPSDS